MKLFIIFNVLFHLGCSQELIYLKSLRGGNVENRIKSTPPYSVYVSASEDSDLVLNQILLKTEHTRSLLDLKNSYVIQNSGLLTPLKTSVSAILTSSLTDQTMSTLTGFLYVTTAKQSNDSLFQVYDANQDQTIQTQGAGNYTVVVLNTHRNISSSTTIGSWNQDLMTSMAMFKGYPKDQEEKMKERLFSNPAMYFSEPIFVPSVEKFSVNFEIFYFKISNAISFTITPIEFDINGLMTSNFKTTGFYMKPSYSNPNITINCRRDTRFNGTTGVLVGASNNLPHSTLSLDFKDGNIYSRTTLDISIGGVIIGEIPESFTISTNNTDGMEVYVQYIILQDQLVPTTTTTFPETTTKISSRLGVPWIITLTISLVFWGL